MDGNRFDDLSRKLATGISRRGALKGAAAGLLGVLGVRKGAGAEPSVTYCGNNFCAHDPGICKDGCVCCIYRNAVGEITNHRCLPPSFCGAGGTPTCGANEVLAPNGGGCVPKCTSAASCPQPGANSCKVATCSAGGVCGFAAGPNDTACGSNKICCGGSCVSKTTTNNCGACGNRCRGATPVCNGNGVCVAASTTTTSTTTSTTTTSTTSTTTSTTSTSTTTEGCRANTLSCASNGQCCSGACVGGFCRARGGPGDSCDTNDSADCQANLTCCGGTCRDLTSDPNNCNACARVCQPGPATNCEGAGTCSAGVCGTAVAASTVVCRAADGDCDVPDRCNGTTKGCPVFDEKREDGTSCGTGEECCGGACCDTATPICGPNGTCVECENSGNCDEGEVCKVSTGTCVECIDASTCDQPAHPCKVATCVMNACVTTDVGPGEPGRCTDDEVCCGGDCTALNTLTNCEGCGDICADNEVCDPAGGCTCPSANVVCGTVCCDAGKVCIADVCSPRAPEGGICDAAEDGDCAAGLECCGGACRDTDTNPNFCGDCGTVCSVPTPYCVDGDCVACRSASDCPMPASGTCQGERTCSAEGVCGFLPATAGTTCRGAAGQCDVAAACDGDSTVCPPNGFKPSTTVCRESAGDCDIEETCTGSSADCPVDLFEPDTVICRSAQDACDAPALCTGTSAACPDNPFLPITVECRAADGACDVAEFCTGSSAACPPDGVADANTVCRPSNGACDVADRCDGMSKACPANAIVGNNESCGTDLICCAGACVSNTSSPNCGACGVTCSGATPFCDATLDRCVACLTASNCPQPTSICQAAATCIGGVCGFSAAAPGTVCRPSVGVCDVAEVCVGTECPADSFQPNTVQCRASAGVCDVAEFCTGVSKDCPADAFVAAGTPCGPAASGVCENQGTCSGTSATCGPKSFKVGTICRPAVNDCDVAEVCGNSANCPIDAKAVNGTACGGSPAPCQRQDTCNNGVCVDRGNLPSGTDCGGTPAVCQKQDRCNSSGVCVDRGPVDDGDSCPGGECDKGICVPCIADNAACTPGDVCCSSSRTCRQNGGSGPFTCRSAPSGD